MALRIVLPEQRIIDAYVNTAATLGTLANQYNVCKTTIGTIIRRNIDRETRDKIQKQKTSNTGRLRYYGSKGW